jgi:hypothetical protein
MMRQERFTTPAALRRKLTVRFPHGSIDIEAVEGNETTVELEAAHGASAAEQAIAEARIELHPAGNGLETIIDMTGKLRIFGWFGAPKLRLRVTLPAGSDIDLLGGSADMSVRGSFGSLKVQTGSGDLDAGECSGAVSVKSGSGDIEIRHVGGNASIASGSGDIVLGLVEGNLTARTASGDIRVEEGRGSVTLQTASGDQRVGAVSSGKIRLQSASGDQHIGIRRGSLAFIDAKTWNGRAHSELNVSDNPVAGDGPRLELRATAASGDITIARV